MYTPNCPRVAYKDKLICKKIEQRPHEIKVVRLNTGTMDDALILAQLKQENEIIANVDVTLSRVYRITNAQLTYTNVIFSVDIDTHDKILENGTMNFQNMRCRVFEIVDTLQCFECMRYGHFSVGCTFSLIVSHQMQVALIIALLIVPPMTDALSR